MILPAAPKAQNPDTVEGNDLTVDAVAALGRGMLIGCVVIAVDIQNRAFGHGHQKA